MGKLEAAIIAIIHAGVTVKVAKELAILMDG